MSDYLGPLAKRLNIGRPVDVGGVTFLINAVNTADGPSYEVWLQGACRGLHEVHLTVASESDFYRDQRIDLYFSERLSVTDDEVQSYFIPIREIGLA